MPMSMGTRALAVGFEAPLYAIGSSTLLKLPEAASARLPSRGQVAVRGTIAGKEVRTVLEPDGRFGHWMRVPDDLRRAIGLGPGDSVAIELEPAERWPEPVVPPDLQAALSAAPRQIQDLWEDITPMARWEWVRWVNATANPDTRRRRVEVTVSKMKSGKRRPCCFNLASCTDPELARSGRLREPG